MVKRDSASPSRPALLPGPRKPEKGRPPNDDAGSAAAAATTGCRISGGIRFRREQEDFALGRPNPRVPGAKGADVSVKINGRACRAPASSRPNQCRDDMTSGGQL